MSLTPLHSTLSNLVARLLASLVLTFPTFTHRRNFVIIMVTPVAISTIGWRYYIVFSVICACIPVSVYFLYPETMGRNLEEIDFMFRDSPSAWATVKYARTRPVAMPQEFAKKNKTDHVEGVAINDDSDNTPRASG